MAGLLEVKSPAVVIDPACGQGQLLVAVADRFGTAGIRFVGVDKDSRALDQCGQMLGARNAKTTLHRADFFKFGLSPVKRNLGNVYVIMNPPFRGYAHLSRRQRQLLKKSVPDLRGRYNLAHAFLKRLISQLEPAGVVGLMPGTWPGAQYNDLRSLLDLDGNSWQILPEPTFDGASTTAGLVVLRTIRGIPITDSRIQRATNPSDRFIKQGVATGADEIFLKIARLKPRSGKVVPAARGREVAASSGIGKLPKIWVPPREESWTLIELLGKLPKADREALERRSCVKYGRKPNWAFHEALPGWFLGTPKLIIPEVCTKMSVLVDLSGQVLPLHSAIAIQARGGRDAEYLSSFLFSDTAWAWLGDHCPRMVNNAIRLTVPRLRELFAGMGD